MGADTPEYDAVYREYAPRVHALARRRLHGKDVTEDIVQEVFIRAFKALPELDLDRPLWPWLRRVCINVCTDVLRSPRTWAEQPVEDFPELAAPAGVDPVSVVMADEQRQAIVDALDTLAPRQREILLRRVVDGTSSEDMAAGEQSSVEAVKSAVKRGRHTFRRAYTDIAGERGLLGTPPALQDRLVARLRAVIDSCARVCNEVPAWQSLPVALSAVVLGLGLGAVQHSSGSAAGAAEPPDRWAVGAAFDRSGAGAPPHSSSATTRPGGGPPPSSPPGPGRHPEGKRPDLSDLHFESGFTGKPNDEYWVGVRGDLTDLPGDTWVGTGVEMYCSREWWEAKACEVLRAVPEPPA